MLCLDSLQSFEFLHLWDAAPHVPSFGTALNTSWLEAREVCEVTACPTAYRVSLHRPPSQCHWVLHALRLVSLLLVEQMPGVGSPLRLTHVLMSFILTLVLPASFKGAGLAGDAAEGMRFQLGW